jgi:uncharacterized RDD family membrane protein YckC
MTKRRGARIAATLIDVACMLPWIGVVAAAGAVLLSSGITRSVDAVAGNVIAFVVVIVPITVAAAGFDGAARHATPGKRLLRLRVTSGNGSSSGSGPGSGPAFFRALGRNAIKFALPWELGHTAVFALVGSSAATPLWVTIVLVAAYAIPIVSLVLLLVTGRPLHDRLTGTSVVVADAREHNEAGGPSII